MKRKMMILPIISIITFIMLILFNMDKVIAGIQALMNIGFILAVVIPGIVCTWLLFRFIRWLLFLF